MLPAIQRLAVAIGVALMPTVAFAHAGVGDPSGLAHGFLHPVTGIDHVLAMMLVGVLAWQLGGRVLWLVPTTFVLVMAPGGALGTGRIAVPFVELGIALSVIVLGAVVALRIQAPVAMAAVGLFAVFHGHAHGTPRCPRAQPGPPMVWASWRPRPFCTQPGSGSCSGARATGMGRPSSARQAGSRPWRASPSLPAISDDLIRRARPGG